MSRRNEDAVSPVIGVILMVAITVILAAVIAAFAFGLGSSDPKGPTAAITAENYPETIGTADLKIQHKGGDTLQSGDWKISIVPVGNHPVYRVSSADFNVGDQIITMNVTDYPGANYNVTNSAIEINPDPGSAARLVSGQKYEVKIIVYPFKSVTLDTVVEVR